MADSEKNSPGEQSDAPHVNPEVPPRPRNSWFLGAFVMLVCLLTAGAVAVAGVRVGESRTESAPLSWPEMAAPGAVESPVPIDASAPIPSTDGLAAAIGPLMDQAALRKGTLGIAVTDVLTGEVLYANRADDGVVPASTLKVATTLAALEAVGPGHRIPTTVVAGSEPGQVIIVGAGDATLAADRKGFYRNAASLKDLAEQVMKALDGVEVTSVGYDTSMFTGDTVASGVDRGDIGAGYTAPLAAMMLDGGRMGPDAPDSPSQRHSDPAKHAATVFARHLGVDSASPMDAPGGAEQLGVVYSPPMQQLVERALLVSDNLLTDMIGLQVAVARGEEGSFTGMGRAIPAVISELGVPVDGVTLFDGSGLSEDNRVTASFLAALFTVAASPDHPNASGVFSGLPVAGYSGSLWYRFSGGNDSAVGDVRAKTGTLAKVASIAGTVVSADGRALAFALVMNGRSDYSVQDALDTIATAIADCGCR